MIVAGAPVIGDLVVIFHEILLELSLFNDICEPMVQSGIAFLSRDVEAFEAKVGVHP